MQGSKYCPGLKVCCWWIAYRGYRVLRYRSCFENSVKAVLLEAQYSAEGSGKMVFSMTYWRPWWQYHPSPRHCSLTQTLFRRSDGCPLALVAEVLYSRSLSTCNYSLTHSRKDIQGPKWLMKKYKAHSWSWEETHTHNRQSIKISSARKSVWCMHAS